MIDIQNHTRKGAK